MSDKVSMNKVYKKSPKLIIRNISGRLIIIPLNKGKGDLEEAFFSLNKTASAVWESINGRDTLKAVASALGEKYSARAQVIEKDLIGLVGELKKRGMVVEA